MRRTIASRKRWSKFQWVGEVDGGVDLVAISVVELLVTKGSSVGWRVELEY